MFVLHLKFNEQWRTVSFIKQFALLFLHLSPAPRYFSFIKSFLIAIDMNLDTNRRQNENDQSREQFCPQFPLPSLHTVDEFNYFVWLSISQNEIIDNVPAQSPSVIFVLFSLFLVSALDLCREILWFDSFTTTSLCANFIHREKHGGNWRSIAEEKYSNNEQIRITITI